ncbi:hypothetical protein AADR41_01775 [Streptomyces sp. CLV115]|uniref:hypothetical protein n=1 Tax=Streptomyces sp. CLV115 TaxID=3138502 RepID=UPI00313BEB0E
MDLRGLQLVHLLAKSIRRAAATNWCSVTVAKTFPGTDQLWPRDRAREHCAAVL